jgi:thioredoxin reductase
MKETTVTVIGGGPAGVAATIWLHQFGIPTILIEAGDALGGLQRRSPYLNNWIPGVQGKHGQDIAAALHEHTKTLGCEVRLNTTVKKVDSTPKSFTLHLQTDDALRSQYIVIATGTLPRSGGFTESDHVGIGPGISMERIAVKDKRIAILGGGDNAFDQAQFVLQRGARQVRIFARQKPRAHPRLQARIPLECVTIGPFVADQKTMSVGQEKFDVIGVQFGFEAIILDGLPVKQEKGYIAVDRSGETSLKRVYACGDVTNFWQPCVTTACAHGIQVAQTIASALSP